MYRSRLAEAYTKSHFPNDSSAVVSSSGIEADLSLFESVNDSVRVLLQQDGIEQHLSPHWTQTTQTHLDKPEIIVFMSKSVHNDAQKFLQVPKEKTIVWSIADMPGVYPKIKQNVDDLLQAQKLS